MQYTSKASYPPIRVDGKNAAYARMMLGNVGGQISEMSAVGAYFYDHIVTEAHHKEISEAFHHISIVEMRHLEIFSELAYLLGGDPRLWECRNNQMVYWSPAYLSYHRNIRRILTAALTAEQKAIRKYTLQSKQICDPNIVAILHRIIEDEEVHVKIFESFLSELPTTAPC